MANFPNIPNYHIGRLIAEGGTARVYWGIDMRSGYPVAIKELKARHFRNKNVRDNFKNIETQLYLNLQHKNIPRLVDFIELPNRDELYIVMEFIDGISLEQHIYGQVGLIPDNKALPMFCEILETVAYIHRRGYLHLDIKSNNIMLTKEGHVKLIDLGIASRLSAAMSGTMGYGTPAYMPPEQSSKAPCGRYTDIFALGVMLFEMLTGRTPFNSDLGNPRAAISDIQRKIANEPTPKMKNFYPFINDDLQLVVDRALEKDPRRRYQTCEEFIFEIHKYQKKHKSK